MTLKPVGPTLFIQPDARTKTERGLFLPTVAQDDACTGVVLAIGDGAFVSRESGRERWLRDEEATPPAGRAQPLRVGDRVVYTPEKVRIVPFGYGADAPVRYLLDVRDVAAVIPA